MLGEGNKPVGIIHFGAFRSWDTWGFWSNLASSATHLASHEFAPTICLVNIQIHSNINFSSERTIHKKKIYIILLHAIEMNQSDCHLIQYPYTFICNILVLSLSRTNLVTCIIKMRTSFYLFCPFLLFLYYMVGGADSLRGLKAVALDSGQRQTLSEGTI